MPYRDPHLKQAFLEGRADASAMAFRHERPNYLTQGERIPFQAGWEGWWADHAPGHLVLLTSCGEPLSEQLAATAGRASFINPHRGGRGTLTIVGQTDTIPQGSNTPVLAPGRYVRFQVTDTGCGMDSATLARAVEPFFSTKQVGRGTGLGLSMVHGMAMQSGGAFHLASTAGVGTTATLWLPVAHDAPETRTPSPLAVPAAPRRIPLLLVDDEPLVRASTSGLLCELGYETIEAGSAAEALELIRTGLNPEIVITDHMMPGMTGAQLAAELRLRKPGLPVLLVTGYASLASKDGQDLEVLAKPFTFADLAARVASLMEMPTGDKVVPLPVRSPRL